jgi:hypothetical protein
MAPLLGIDLGQLVKKGPPRPAGAKTKQQAPALDADALEGVRLTLMFGADMFDSPVEDVVLEHQGTTSVVVTVDQEYMIEGTAQRLLGCDYKVLGKVSRVLMDGSSPINLTRRCALGLLPNAQVVDYFE